MRITGIASGSSGNCLYVGSDTTHLLIDAGISGKRIIEGVNKLDLDIKDIDGILITHEHSDHIGGLGVMARKYNIPIYATKATKRAIMNCSSVGEIDEDLFEDIIPNERFMIKDITVNPMHVSHDAADPVAYRFSYNKKNIGIITDLGKFDDYTVECLKNMDVLFLEANHDVNMLQVGPYPYPLKRRILGEKGHLSNEAAGDLLSRVINDKMKAVFLGHLSKENNLPELAFESVRVEVMMQQQMKESSECININDIKMIVAQRSDLSEIVCC